MSFQSLYEILHKRLEQENNLVVLSSKESYAIISELHEKMAQGEAAIREKELQAEKELSSVVLNA